MDKAAPLYLLGFDKTQSLMLRGKISKAIRHEENRPKDTDKQPNKDPLRDLEVPALPTNTNYFITVNDKFSGTVIRLGLLDSASEKLRPFEQDFFPSIKQ